MFEEKLAYQLDERMRDMNDMVDSCHNRVSNNAYGSCCCSTSCDLIVLISD